jgi:hypothetical protein
MRARSTRPPPGAYCVYRPVVSEWLAALIVGIPAVVISVIALIYARHAATAARRSAEAAEETARVDRARRHEERTPQFTPEYEGGNRPVLRLTHTGGADCDEVVVTLRAPGAEPAAITGFRDMRPPWVISPFRVGDHHSVGVQAAADDGGRVIVHCRCRSGEEAWDVRVSLDVRGNPRAFWA